MSQANFKIDLLVFDDAEATNDPQQRILDYTKDINIANVSKPQVQKLVLSPSGSTAIAIPSGALWLYVESDQTIKLRFNGSVTDEVDVSPTLAGTKDGIFFKRGAFSSLSINVPGAVSPNITIFVGA